MRLQRADYEAKSQRLIDAYQERLLSLEELRERTGPLRTRQRAMASELNALQAGSWTVRLPGACHSVQ